MDPLLSSRLQSLRPIPASDLLDIAAPFLLIAAKRLSSSSRVQTIHYILEEWYEKQAKKDSYIISNYPVMEYPSVCYNCYNIRDRTSSNLAIHCSSCCSRGTYDVRFITSLISQSYGIHPVQIEAAFARAIYNMRHNNNGN